MSKFKVGQRVYLFNSMSLQIEEDVVYAELYVPMALENVEQHSDKELSERIAAGEMKVQEQYQLVSHQGIVDAECLFASEEECRAFFREFFK